MSGGEPEPNRSATLSAAKQILLERRLQGKRRTSVRASTGLSARPPDTPRYAAASQQTLWLLDRAAGDSPAFNISSSFKVSDYVDLDRLESSVRTVVTRHDILRSTYRMTGDAVEQVVHENRWYGLERILVASGEKLESAAAREVRFRFDLEHGPLFRLLHLSHGGNAGLLILVIHDIIFDKWSMQLFWREVGTAYDTSHRDESLSLPMPDFQFEDFAHWQRTYLDAGAQDQQLAYWKKHLTNPPAPLPLPTDHPYPSRLTDAGRLAQGTVSASAVTALRSLAAAENASLFVVTLLAYQLLLQRLAGVEDLLVASPVANRRLPETAAMIGFFLSTVPFRTDLRGDPTVREAIRRVRQTVAEALENQDVALDQIVAAVRPPREPGRHPLTQVMFVYQRESEAEPPLHLDGVRVENTYIETGVSKFDLTLFVGESADGFKTTCEYRTDLFDHPTMERWLLHYARMIETMVAHPDRKISRLEFLTAVEAGFGWPDPTLPVDEIPDVVTAIGRVAHAEPHQPALHHAATTLEYGELWNWSGVIAATVQEATRTPATRIGLFLPKSPAAIAAILGILRAGAAYVPVDPTYPAARIRAMLADADVGLILTSPQLANAAEAMAVAPIAVVTDRPPTQSRAPFTNPTISGGDPAYIIYTSGSTGTPKGVEISHANLGASTTARGVVYRPDPGNFLLLPSLSFDSSVAGIFWTLSGGGALVLPTADEQRDPAALARLIGDRKVNTSLAIPSLWQEILPLVKAPAPHLHTMIVAGESCPPGIVESHLAALPACALFNEYGPTEATVWATVHACQPPDATTTRVPIGRAVPGARLHILDGNQRAVPTGVVGELWIGGAGVAPGYWRRPEVTAEKFRLLPELGRCYRTGDHARWRPDGTVEFLGRGDRQVKISGFRIELDEIEAVLASHPHIAEAVAAVEPVVPDLAAAEAVIARLAPKFSAEMLERWTKEIAAAAKRSSVEERQVARASFRLALTVNEKKFVAPPRKAQRDWLLGQAMDEFADDLDHLDHVARRFVPGHIHDLKQDVPDIRHAALTADQIMEDWQIPLMRAMAGHVTAEHGDVLEIGFGRGVAAEFIQQGGVRSHTVVEMNDHSVTHYFRPWQARHPGDDIRLQHARWQDVEPQLGMYDGIFFHAFPMTEEEFVEYILKSVTFAEHAFPAMAAHLRPGGVFTYLTTEIDSLSRRHQRVLFQHFQSISLHVEKVRVPADTHDTWWADSMVVVKAVK